MKDAEAVSEPWEIDEDVFSWSIGVYTGDTPFDLKPAQEVQNPVIAACNVSDVRAEFVADPFMIEADGAWHMFFEVMNSERRKGEIGLATSQDCLAWNYQRIILTEPFHLSYPHVFYLNGEHYMIPETYQANSVRLYKADQFPDRWTFIRSLLDGRWVDSSIVFFDEKWWMFTSSAEVEQDRLEVFYADAIEGPWRPHAMNPIIAADDRKARPGGRMIVRDGKVIRFAQEGVPDYGMSVRAFEISELTVSTYQEREVNHAPVLSAGTQNWHRGGMHHIDPHFVDGRWLACVDGWQYEPPTYSPSDPK